MAQRSPRGGEFSNPIITGFYPDPSICRAGDDYYLVTSTFEYFPGVPVFHSRDLVHWRQIGHCLTRRSQLALGGIRSSGGIYAPTLRFHDGTFIMVTTLVDGGDGAAARPRGNFSVTARDPAGPWSEPVWLDADGIDPSLFFDDDGTCYYTRHEGMGDGAIVQSRLNLETGSLEGGFRELWRGTGGVWPEGPHMYKVGGKYYLMIAEGGTSYGHRETIARSDSPWGPFVANPANPILTHRGRPGHPLQALGHADMVETPDGTWLVCLGIRPQGGAAARFHFIGRETCLAPVRWSREGWPVVNGNGTIELSMPSPRLPQCPWPQEPARDDFNDAVLGLQWIFIRNPKERDYSLCERPGHLRLWGSPVSLNHQDSPAFVARRQTHLACSVSARVSFDPRSASEEAGIVLRANEKFHYEIGITAGAGGRRVFFRTTVNGVTVEKAGRELGRSDVVLSVDCSPRSYSFFYRPVDGEKTGLGTAETLDLSSEAAGGFTGVTMGMYATGNGRECSSPADFDWFECSGAHVPSAAD
jgi:xylan 1,4-beta-xylosidase